MKVLRVAAIVLFGMFFLGKFIPPAYSARQFDFQDPELSKKTIKGTVSNISRMDQKITITTKGDNKNVVLAISSDTRVVKNGVTISSSDISGIMTGDEVTVSYFEDPQVTGAFIADTITLASK
ncbi:MAG: hypothetical protein NT060_01340 [Candidatus Omnitrophica bacterium]|nr:hypothetical protein [Candidatus Omnitrophota bacterium]